MPVSTTLTPMEARSVAVTPAGSQWQYEPKWAGFRCLLERDGKNRHPDIEIRSRPRAVFSGRDRGGASAARNAFHPRRELIIQREEKLSFDALLQRIHPAASRIKRLAAETPAQFLAFDLLKRGKQELVKEHIPKLRKALEAFAARGFDRYVVRLSPASPKIEDAKRWLRSAGGGCDGVIAKRRDLPYQSGTRDGMPKIKRHRSADCVVGGLRYGEGAGSARRLVGALLLGLYDAEGLLHHVGFTSGLKSAEKKELTVRLKAIAGARSFTGATPGGPSRWSSKRSAEWVLVNPNSSSKSHTITLAKAASATVAAYCDGTPTRTEAMHDGAEPEVNQCRAALHGQSYACESQGGCLPTGLAVKKWIKQWRTKPRRDHTSNETGKYRRGTPPDGSARPNGPALLVMVCPLAG
jgi:ATP-dependent DNA ligase